MPGIFGVVSDDSLDITTCLEKMTPTLLHRPWHHVNSCIRPGCGLACVSLTDGMEIADERGVMLAFYGHIVDWGALRERLKLAGDPCALTHSGPQVLLHIFLQFGMAPLQGLNGYYAIAIWEENTRRLTLIVDRGGLVKVHYWRQDGLFLFAPESKAICWHPRFNKTVDELGFYELMCLTYLLEDRTLFRDIRLMLPATVLTLQEGVVTHSRYWNHRTDPVEPEGAGLRVYADGYYERLREAVCKRMPKEDFGIFLTGGLDSRVLAGMIRACDGEMPVHSFTCGDPSGHDPHYGAKIAKTCRFQHHFVKIGGDYLARYGREAVWRMEGQTTIHVCWTLATDVLTEANELRHMYNGYLGCGNVSADFPDDSNPDKVFRLLLERAFAGFLNEARLDGLVKTRIAADMKGLSLGRLRAQFDAMDGPAVARSEILRRDEQHRKFIGIDMELQGPLSFLLFPYDDNAVWDYLLGIPMRYRRGKVFFLDMIRRKFPELARIPRSGTGVPIGGTEWQRLLHRGWQRVYCHVLPGISGGRWGGRNLEKGVFYADWQRGGSRSFIRDVVAKAELYEDVLEVDEVRRRVNDHLEGRTTDPDLVHVLLSFILWRERFCA